MEEAKSGKMKAMSKRLSPGASFCAAPAGGASAGGAGAAGGGPFGTTELFGSITFAEAAPLTLAFVAFLAVGMWMFRRFGGPTETEAPLEEPVVETAEDREEERERELVNV
jgi:hypothetical protein